MQLDELFRKVSYLDGHFSASTYHSVVTAMGQGNEVENLMKVLLENIQLLVFRYYMLLDPDLQRGRLAEAIKDIARLPPSIPESIIEMGPALQVRASARLSPKMRDIDFLWSKARGPGSSFEDIFNISPGLLILYPYRWRKFS